MQLNTSRYDKTDLHRPHVQVSLDLTTIDEALHLAKIAVEAGVDWLEVGTPLIISEGLLVVVGAPLVIGNEIAHPGESRDEHLARLLSDVVRAVKQTR